VYKVSKGFSIQYLFTDWSTLWSKYFLCTNDQVSIYWQLNVGILFETVISWNEMYATIFSFLNKNRLSHRHLK
jgi:hypothetical protein